jgi:hypothetical protein
MDKQDEQQLKRADNLLVYNVPIELIQQYVSMAKLFYQNQMWKVLEEGMALLVSEKSNVQSEWQAKVEAAISDITKRIENLELIVRVLAEKSEQKRVEPAVSFRPEEVMK